MTAILVYDFCLTVREEVQHIWFSKIGTPAVLFLLLRYVSLCDRVCTILELVLRTNQSRCVTHGRCL